MADPDSTPQDTTNSTVPYAYGISSMETGNNNSATNPNYPVAQGGPLGPHQFLASTWQQFMKENPAYFVGMTPDQALAARTNPQLSAEATNWLAGKNAAVLKAHGLDATPQNLGLAHALGGYGASSILRLPDTTSLTDAFHQTQPNMADTILRLNPQYQKMTVGDIKAKYAGLNNGQYAVPGTPAAVPPPAPAAPTVAQTGATAANPAYPPALAQMQRLALLNRLMPQTQAQAPVGYNAATGGPTGWATALLNSTRPQQNNPLQTVQTALLLRSLQNGGQGYNPLLTGLLG